MAAPVLNRRLTLEEAQQMPDGAGGFVETWAALGTLWAELRPGSGRAREGEAVTLSSVPYRITVRAAPPDAPSRPRSGQRFRDGNRIFRIIAVSDSDTRGRYLTCHATEEQAT